MLARLGLDGFVGGNHEQYKVDTTDTGQHVPDEAFVPRHVHEPQPQRCAVGQCEIQVGKTEVNRDAASLLFFQAVRINARERSHQRRLTMINVPSRAEDHGFHGLQCSRVI